MKRNKCRYLIVYALFGVAMLQQNLNASDDDAGGLTNRLHQAVRRQADNRAIVLGATLEAVERILIPEETQEQRQPEPTLREQLFILLKSIIR